MLLCWVVRNITRICHLHASQITAWLRLGPGTRGNSQGNRGCRSEALQVCEEIPIMIFLQGLPMWSHLLLCRRVDWKSSLLEKHMGSPFPFYRVSRRWERKGLGSALPSTEGRYLQLSGTNSNACRQLGQRKMRTSLCVCV